MSNRFLDSATKFLDNREKWVTITPDMISCEFTAEPEELNIFLTQGRSRLEDSRISQEEQLAIEAERLRLGSEKVSSTSVKDECTESEQQDAKPGDLPGQQVRLSSKKRGK